MANPFYGLKLSDLKEIRDKALEKIKAGEMTIQGAVGGKNFQLQITMPYDKQLEYSNEEIRRQEGNRRTQKRVRFGSG